MIRVLVAANSVVVRAGLEAIVSTSSALSVVGSTTPNSIDRQIDALAPDVVLLAWDWEDDLSAVLSTDDLAAIAVVLLVEELSGGIAESLRQQVRGILPTDASEREITTAIEAASAGLTVLHPGAIETLLPNLPAAPQPALLSQALTPREVEVLTMMAEGLGNKSIARRLQISEHTVKFHIGSIFSKLNATSRTEAVMLGARQGLILL
ncbi:MAG: response regulator transcription factor [Microcoleus sp. SIO2G3]|nr:response regulator transcription factor [Microcoleus sp. SIO2G3]